MKLKDNQRVNIHQNYTLSLLFSILSSTFAAIMNEMQSKTPYGKEYTDCYDYYEKIVTNNLDVFQSLVRKCQDLQEKRGIKK